MRRIRWLVKAIPIGMGLTVLLALGFVALGRIQQLVEAPGEVRIQSYQVVRPQVPGLVTAVRVEPGETVEEGQILLQLQNYDFLRELLSARQGLEEARSRLRRLHVEHELQRKAIHPLEIAKQKAELARSGLEEELAASKVAEAKLALEAARERHRQTQDLADAGLISQRELKERHQEELAAKERLVQSRIQERDARMLGPSLTTELELLSSEQRRELATLKAEIQELEAQVKEWTVQVEQLQRMQELHTLRATMDGVLVGVSPRDLLGQYVQTGQELWTVIDTDSIQFVTRIPEQALVQVRTGQPVQVEVTGLPKDRFQLFAGRVGNVLQEPDTDRAGGTPTYPVQIHLDDPWISLKEGRFYLRGGMRGTAKIAYRRDIPILRAVYEFLVGKPKLPEPSPRNDPIPTVAHESRALPGQASSP